MRINIPVKKGLQLFLFCVSVCSPIVITAQSTYGDFPYYQSFLSSGKPAECTVPTPSSGTNAVSFTTKGLQLTPAQTAQFGAVFINNRTFTSINGIRVEFEYMMHSGTGGDGLSMFLFDASVSNPVIGANGAGIGYAYNLTDGSATHAQHKKQGLSGAYMGVALDAFGNFKGLRYQGESRVNGIPFYTNPNGISVEGYIPMAFNTRDQVTIRGARGKERTYVASGYNVTAPEGYTGYPVLITQSTSAEHGFVKADNETANYIQLSGYKGNKFAISGGKEFTDSSDPAYRKVIMELFPAESSAGGGFYVTVKIQHGQQVDELISDYHYKESFYYQENAMVPFRYNTEVPITVPPKYVLDAKVPKFLNIGFAASTGESTNIHVIKHLTITLPGGTIANPDDAIAYKNTAVSLSPLTNDIAFKGTISKNQVGNASYIDPSSFRFRLADGTIISSTDYTAPEGKWQYNATTQQVTFTPTTGFLGDAVIYYDIKGKEGLPYTDEAYRSLPATITVTVEEPPAPTYILMNRMVSPVVK